MNLKLEKKYAEKLYNDNEVDFTDEYGRNYKIHLRDDGMYNIDVFIDGEEVDDGICYGTSLDAVRFMMNNNNPIHEIMRFQSDRNLDKMEYNPHNEAASTIEEVLESLGYDTPRENRGMLNLSIKNFVTSLLKENIIVKVKNQTIYDSVDAHLDQIVFAIGAVMKLGFNPTLSLLETAKEISSRRGKIIDGKFEKFKEGEDGYQEPYKADYSLCTTKG